MKVFLDTSVIVKFYYNQEGSSRIENIFNNYLISELLISEISRVEFYSAVYKNVRTKSLSLKNAEDILNAFISDTTKYTIIPITLHTINIAQDLIVKYGLNGLRAMDALQLASVKSVEKVVDLALSDDKTLNTLMSLEGFVTDLPHAS